nr:hypothetical protein [uncultured Methanobrevibacter sp.]
MDQVHDLDVTYIDSTLSFYVNPERKWEGPFYYIISHNLEECFNHHCKSKYYKFDFYVYRHLGYAMNKYLKCLIITRRYMKSILVQILNGRVRKIG